jgi:hypothetical protein
MLETGIPGMERLRDEAMNHTKLRSKKSLEDVEPTQNIEFQNTNGDVNKQTLNKMETHIINSTKLGNICICT